MKRFSWILLIIICSLGLFLAMILQNNPAVPKTTTGFTAVQLPADSFERASGPREWSFPADFGPHPGYQTEWWYYTGNLSDDNGRHFGYQLTFFRRAIDTQEGLTQRPSAWATHQIYLAHFALSDVEKSQHYAFERFSRGAVGLAGAQSEPYRVWLENWRVEEIKKNQYSISAQQGDVSIHLLLEDLKGPVLHGDQGYSQKGPETGNASYYYSQTRLQTTGTIQTPGGVFQVSGLSWKDHEFSTSALSDGQVGWDWFSIQLDDESELMFFQIRREDGSVDPFSSGTWISPTGETTPLSHDEFVIQVQDTWQSPHTKAEYPSAWYVNIPAMTIEIEIRPFLEDQEMNVSYAYWEGAVTVNGSMNGAILTGNGYVEMTGYAASMEGEF